MKTKHWIPTQELQPSGEAWFGSMVWAALLPRIQDGVPVLMDRQILDLPANSTEERQGICL